MDIDFKIKGFEELIKNMEQLPQKVNKKVVYKAAGAGAKVMRLKVTENAKAIDIKDKEIESKIWKYVKSRNSKALARKYKGGAYRVGIEGGASGKDRIPPTYWRYVEFGTSKTRAQPFFRAAIKSASERSINRIMEVMKLELDDLVSKLPKTIK